METVRSPRMQDSASPTASLSPTTDLAGVGQLLRAALEPVRIRGLSLHTESGDAEWTSEGTVGPDEHRAVHDALEQFASRPERVADFCGLGNSRSAITLRVENSANEMLGAVLVIVDTPAAMRLAKNESALLNAAMQHALQEYAALRQRLRRPPRRAAVRATVTAVPSPPATPPPDAPAPAASTSPVEPADHAEPLATEPLATEPLATEPLAAAESSTVPSPPPGPESLQVPESSPLPPEPATTPAGVDDEGRYSQLDRLSATLRASQFELHAQRLVPLHDKNQPRRYEVLLRSRASLTRNAAPRVMLKTAIANGLGSMIDRRVLTELTSVLTRNPALWQVHGQSFSINLTRTSLHDPHFLHFVELCLSKAALPAGTIGFEVDLPTAVRTRDRLPDIAAAFGAMGCPLIIDDFLPREEVFALVTLPGVTMVKIPVESSTRTRKDRIAKAALAGLVQRVRAQRVLTVAKRTRSRADEEWISDLGFDYVQSHAFSLPVTMASLARRFGIDSASQ